MNDDDDDIIWCTFYLFFFFCHLFLYAFYDATHENNRDAGMEGDKPVGETHYASGLFSLG